MYVYIVVLIWSDNFDIQEVFSSYELAESFVKEAESDSNLYGYYEIISKGVDIGMA